jgi:general secretion pathway protein J
VNLRGRHRGFTLIELLVALFIVAVMFAMGYASISQGASTREALKQQQAHLLELETTIRVMEQDFVQAAPRPVRQPVGDPPDQPAFAGALPGTQPIVALTRSGWANPAGVQRTGLQRVAYFLENGTLRREYWNVLDPTLASKTLKRDLMTHVKALTLRYCDESKNWNDQWPPEGPQSEHLLRQRPLAVEVSLDTEDWGKIVRIIEVAE